METGVMICGHGSRDPGAVAEFEALVGQLRTRIADRPVAHGFLEFARPVIRDGLDRLRALGVRRVEAVPAMLFAAGHMKNDIPSVLNTYAATHAGFDIGMGADLGFDPRLHRAGGARIEAAVAAADAAGRVVPRTDTLLMVVGRGTSDPDANGNIAKVGRMLCEGLGFGWGEVCYSGVTFPLVGPALRHAARLGYGRIVLFPYFLFTGVLVRRIYAQMEAVAAEYPRIEFVRAGYLNDHPLVLDTFMTRLADIRTGDGTMNCQLCKYRAHVLGFEADIGVPQQSHHHHVEGTGTGDPAPGHSHAHDRDHGSGDHGPGDHGPGHHHGHRHGPGGHTHRPYPNADHPHGPRSLAGV